MDGGMVKRFSAQRGKRMPNFDFYCCENNNSPMKSSNLSDMFTQYFLFNINTKKIPLPFIHFNNTSPLCSRRDVR